MTPMSPNMTTSSTHSSGLHAQAALGLLLFQTVMLPLPTTMLLLDNKRLSKPGVLSAHMGATCMSQ